jgi:DNA-binding NarL/FixJ family response regulator
MMEKLSLLLVDDEPDVLAALKLWLLDEGYSVYTATSRSEALTALEEFPIEICLIDLKMKEVDGVQLSRELSKIDDLLKIIIITGYPTYETALDAMKTGVFDYISKASDNKEILKRINRAAEARKREIAAKTRKIIGGKNMILICKQVMIKEAIEKFCSEEPTYHLAHTYSSLDYIENNELNAKESLVLPCAECNRNHFSDPKKMIFLLKSHFPLAKVLTINTQLSDEEKKIMIKAGARGFLPKNASREVMKTAFEAVLSGQMWVSRKVTYELLDELLSKPSARSGEDTSNKIDNKYELSLREIEIVRVMASGLSNSDISNKLLISEKTVKAHIYNIYRKMEVKSRTQAIIKATETHII